MKKDLIALSLPLVVLFMAGYIHDAKASLGLQEFGGRIVYIKALEIQVLEAAGFVCTVPGKTIQILPVRAAYPKSYLIPAGIKSKTNTTPMIGQKIKGFYSPIKVPITCVNSQSGITKIVNLSSITLWGTSQF
jgi:hypothetical protein